jgi:hypothetical protein
MCMYTCVGGGLGVLLEVCAKICVVGWEEVFLSNPR